MSPNIEYLFIPELLKNYHQLRMNFKNARLVQPTVIPHIAFFSNIGMTVPSLLYSYSGSSKICLNYFNNGLSGPMFFSLVTALQK